MRQALHPAITDLARGAETHAPFPGLRRQAATLLAHVRAWRRAAATRTELAALSPALQADIGVQELVEPRNGPILGVDGDMMRRLMAIR